MPGLLQNRSQMPPTSHASNGARLVSITGEDLPVRSITLVAEAQGGIARTRLLQHFSNTHDTALELTYAFPLPADGAAAGYQIQAGTRVITGRVERREKARADFNKARLEGRTAGLVDQERANLFTQHLGNIPARTDVTVELTIDHPLAWIHGGIWEWRFPTVVAPRYLGAAGVVSDAEAVTVDVVNGPTPPKVSVSLTIADDLTSAPTSPTHAISNADHTVSLAADAPLDRDIVVRWAAVHQAPGLTLRRARPPKTTGDVDSAYGLLTIVPPAGGSESLARDLVLLLDVSGSMSGKPLEHLKAVVTGLVESLGDQDRLEMVAFASGQVRYRKEPVHASARERKEACAWIRKLRADGGTEMISAIAEALRPLRADAARQVVIVTDGQIGFEATAVSAIRDGLPTGSRLHTVGVGSATNQAFLHAGARAGRGVEVLIGLDEPAAPGAARILAATREPAVVDVTVQGTALAEAPPRLPDLLAGSPVLAGIRLRPEGGTLIVSGRTTNGEWKERLEVPATLPGEGADAVAALWAREAIEDLELDLACGGVKTKIDPMIEDIALRHSIASRLTSWIAVAEEPSVDPREPVRVERIPQALPYGLSADSLGLRGSVLLGAPMASRAMARHSVSKTEVTEDLSALVAELRESAQLRSSIPGLNLRDMFRRLTRRLDDVLHGAQRELDEKRRVAAEIEQSASTLPQDLSALEAPTPENRAGRQELLNRLMQLADLARSVQLPAEPLMVAIDRLRELIDFHERQTKPPLLLRGRMLPTPARPTTTIEIFATQPLNWHPATSASIANGTVDVVAYGTTRPGEVGAGSLVRLELSVAPGDVAGASRLEIESGDRALTVTLGDTD